MNKLLAQQATPLGNLEGLGTIGLEGDSASNAPGIFNQVISIVVGAMTMIAAIYFLFQVISGAYAWIGSGGDKGAVENARKKITHGIIGLVVVFAALFLVNMLGQIFNIPYITNPANLIEDIAP